MAKSRSAAADATPGTAKGGAPPGGAGTAKPGAGGAGGVGKPATGTAAPAVAKPFLGAAQPLPAFLASAEAAGGLSAEDRHTLVEQALELIESLYVHLPLKRAMHAVDPVQRLRLLRARLERLQLSDAQFHR